MTKTKKAILSHKTELPRRSAYAQRTEMQAVPRICSLAVIRFSVSIKCDLDVNIITQLFGRVKSVLNKKFIKRNVKFKYPIYKRQKIVYNIYVYFTGGEIYIYKCRMQSAKFRMNVENSCGIFFN